MALLLSEDIKDKQHEYNVNREMEHRIKEYLEHKMKIKIIWCLACNSWMKMPHANH